MKFAHSSLYRALCWKERELEHVAATTEDGGTNKASGRLCRVRDLIVRLVDREERRMHGKRLL